MPHASVWSNEKIVRFHPYGKKMPKSNDNWRLAQLNIATLRAPIDSPQLADFVAELDRINSLAEQSPGFLWRLQTDEGDATGIDHPFGEDTLVNMSVWSSIQSLHDYVYRTDHSKIMSERKRWFHRIADAYHVLWWIPGDKLPDLQEAHCKLMQLREKGPSPAAFHFKAPYGKPSTH